MAPTILDFLRIPAPASFEGHSLLAADHPHQVYSETVYAHDAFGWAPLRSLRLGDYKYIEAPAPELYNVATDPHEQNNLLSKEPAKAQALRADLRKLLADHAAKHPASPAAISPRTRALLASLGYLSSGPRSAKAGGAGADPKDRLSEYRLYEEAQLALYERRLDQAVTILRKVLASDPRNILARRDLGGTYVDLHLYAKARVYLQQVVAEAPDDYMAQYELGVADRKLGLYPEALVHLETACNMAPAAEQCRRELESLKEESSSR